MATKRNLLVLEQIHVGFLYDMDHWGHPTGNIPHILQDTDPSEVTGVVFGGGVDINSSIYNELPGNFNQRPDNRRDKIEIAVFNWAKKNDIPMIGVCRGAQLLTALNGGKLIQHVTGHGGDHDTITNDGEIIEMNSCHHQMMFPWASRKEFRIFAHCNPKRSIQYLGSGVRDVFNEWDIPDIFVRLEFVEPEVVWWPGTRALCIQGHPEWMPKRSTMVQYINGLLNNLVISNGNKVESSPYCEQARS